MKPTSAGRLAGAAAAALLLAGLAACGGDDDTEASTPTDQQAEAGEGLAGASGDGELAAYCAAELTLEATSATADFEGDPVGAAESLLADAEAAREVAPAEVVPMFDAGIATLQGVVDSGDPSALESFDSAPIHAFDLENCGWESAEVTATDYAFDGVPTELSAGPTSFEVTNDGAEAHVLVILAKADGVTESWDEIMAAGGEDSGLYEELGGAFAPPGGEGYGVVDLPAGDYMATCPIPTGTTGEAPPGTGPPHFVHGMMQEFTVT